MSSEISVVFYSEINLFCILLLFTIMYKAVHAIDKRRMDGLFIGMVTAIIAFLGSDLAWGLIDNGFVNAPPIVNYILNILYFILGGVASFLWFLYSEKIQKSLVISSRRCFILSAIPLVLLIILTVTSFKTGFLFYIDETNRYHRGAGYLLQMLLSYGYMFFTSIKAFFKALKKDNYVKRNEYLIVASFVIMPLIFGFLQTYFVGIPMLCVGITISVLLVYLNSQELLISIDPLTNMNNRNQMIRYLSSKMRHLEEGKFLFLLMVDIDYFKQINDRYGHVEGDHALIMVANTLKEACGKYNCFGARYGGDEFVLVYETSDSKNVEDFCRYIHGSIKGSNKAANVPYTVTISIGCAEYPEGLEYIPDFIALVDAELYKVKRARV